MATVRRRVQSAEIRFGPALKALGACLLIGGAAIAYVRQQHELVQLGDRMKFLERQKLDLADCNQGLQARLNELLASGYLEREVRKRLPELGPTRPGQVVVLPALAGSKGWGERVEARCGLAEGGRP